MAVVAFVVVEVADEAVVEVVVVAGVGVGAKRVLSHTTVSRISLMHAYWPLFPTLPTLPVDVVCPPAHRLKWTSMFLLRISVLAFGTFQQPL